VSETAIARDLLSRFCCYRGLDLGCGDDLIVPWAIGIDWRQLGCTNIIGDVVNPCRWFQPESMDFVFSSHCLEDFDDIVVPLKNWFRVLRIHGVLVLFLPDQQRYLKHCEENNTQPNQDHKHANFSMDFVLAHLGAMRYVADDIMLKAEPIGVYSFALVVRKPDCM